MKLLPSDPFAYQGRFWAALFSDLSDSETFKRDGFARTNALRAVSVATGPDAASFCEHCYEPIERCRCE